ncbi:hypothetical protein [Joostella sp. CR20]|uniref:hypothetical protein n=1 Tax=Joostella sp. CR20 TaxID=2804312 RepID=UPI00313B9E06
MKTKTLLVILFGIILNINAQNTFPSSSNVGIGTLNPEHGKLHISGTGASQGINLWTKSGETTSRIWIDNQNKTFHLSKGDNPINGITINNNGLVGIGEINPEYGRLHINGNGASQGINLWTKSGETTSRIWIDNQNKTFHLSKGNNPINGITINNNGLVGIGEINPNSKLSVNGKIHAKEVKIDLIGWSDFVFYDNYNLPTLFEVETHIKEKGHLKDIPSAKEVAENGIFLGEMDSKLLQKIEELMLYTIQQQKEIENLKKENNGIKLLNDQLLQLQKRMDKLEKK